jgi:hypothetical protein
VQGIGRISPSQRHRGTYCITVGTHMYDLLALEPGAEDKLKSIRIIASGAGAHRLFADAERRFGFKVLRGLRAIGVPGPCSRAPR